MKTLIKLKHFTVTLLRLAVISSMVVSCSPASVIENQVSNEQPPAATEGAQSNLTETFPDLENAYGISVAVKSLCSDGVQTTLVLQTDLNPKFWYLNETDFYPRGKTYYETSISLLENDQMYSNVSSGKRDDPLVEAQNVSTIQTFVFPKTPLSNSEFTIKAKVTLGDLPQAYTPPAGVDFMETGIIEIPMEYVVSATLGECP